MPDSALFASNAPDSPFCSIDEALEEIRTGRMVVLVDAPDRENEGDLILPAEFVTPATLARLNGKK